MKLEFFLNKFFNDLEKKKINYCVLRNYKSLPKKLDSNDIDILVNKKDLGYIIKIIQKYCDIVLINQRDYLVGLTLSGITNSNKKFLKIDLVTKIAWKGLSFLDNKLIFDHKITYKKKIFIPQKHHETIITFFSSYIVGGWINTKYQKEIRKQFIENKKKITETLELKFSKSIIKIIYKGIINKNYKILIKYVNKLRAELIFYYTKKITFKILIKIFKHYLQEAKMKYSDYAMIRLHIEYNSQSCRYGFSKLFDKDIKVFFKHCLHYKKRNLINNYLSNFQNPYKLPLLILGESINSKTKINRTLINIYRPDLIIKIKSQNYKNLLKNKEEIIQFLKLKSKQRINNAFL